MITIRELGIEGQRKRMIEKERLSKRDIGQQIFKRMEKGKRIGFEDIKSDDGDLHKDILGKFGSYYEMYKYLRLTGHSIVTVEREQQKVIRKWDKSRVKSEILSRWEKGLDTRISRIQKDDAGLSNAIARYYGTVNRVKYELMKEGKISKQSVRWTKDLVNEEFINRIRLGLSLKASDIQRDDSLLYSKILEFYDGIKNIKIEMGIKNERKTNTRTRKWDYESVKKEYYRRYLAGEDLDSSLKNAISRHAGGIRQLKKELGIEVKEKRKWDYESVKEEFLRKYEKGEEIDGTLRNAIYRYVGGTTKLKEELGIEVDQTMLNRFKPSKYQTKEDVFEGYHKFLKEENSGERKEIKKKNSALHGRIYKFFKGFNEFQEEYKEYIKQKEDDEGMSEEVEEYQINKDGTIEKESDDIFEQEINQNKTNQNNDNQIQRAIEQYDEENRQRERNKQNESKSTEKVVTITIKNSDKLENITFDGELKNIHLDFQ